MNRVIRLSSLEAIPDRDSRHVGPVENGRHAVDNHSGRSYPSTTWLRGDCTHNIIIMCVHGNNDSLALPTFWNGQCRLQMASFTLSQLLVGAVKGTM